jgi:hypothetical protein
MKINVFCQGRFALSDPHLDKSKSLIFYPLFFTHFAH